MSYLRRFGNVAGLFGTLLKWYGALFLVPLGVALWTGQDVVSFAAPLGLASLIGYLLERKFPDTELERADGFLLVVLTWVAVSLIGSVPYIVAAEGTLGEPINAIFESVSGFTCTGSTIMGEISLDRHSHAILLWRQFTQWLGGMGILVLAVAILPRLSVGGAQFLDNEVPGPQMDRLTPHMAETARRLWILYTGATVLLAVLFLLFHVGGLAPKMDLFQAISHAFTTLPSGGFSPQARSIEAFSPAVQWLIVPFMFVAAMNFVLLWRALTVGPRELRNDTEFKTYLGLFVGGGLLVSGMLGLHDQFATFEQTVREGTFQLATILTTTGYASTDFALWPQDVLVVLIVLMFVSGCVGSTSGGLKIMRWLIGLKVVARELVQRIHPSSVLPLRLGDRVVKDDVVRGATVLIVVYLGLFAFSWILVTLDTHLSNNHLEITEAMTAVAVTLGNIGPGLGRLGPMESFEFLPVFSKFWLCFLMIAGRLEIMTCLVLVLPDYWTD